MSIKHISVLCKSCPLSTARQEIAGELNNTSTMSSAGILERLVTSFGDELDQLNRYAPVFDVRGV